MAPENNTAGKQSIGSARVACDTLPTEEIGFTGGEPFMNPEIMALIETLNERGNTVIVGPEGDILAGPLTGEEGVLYAEIDVARARTSRQQFDPVGHYSRPDIFRLSVDTSPRPAVTELNR